MQCRYVGDAQHAGVDRRHGDVGCIACLVQQVHGVVVGGMGHLHTGTKMRAVEHAVITVDEHLRIGCLDSHGCPSHDNGGDNI